MNKTTLVGIDIAKNIFQLHGVDASGNQTLRKKINRSQLLSYTAQHLAPCKIVMEACGGSHYWAQQFMKLGCEVKLISPQFVKPFVKTNKNDANDAEAIVIAALQPGMRYVSIKTKEQQDIQCLHRMRSRAIGDRTELINQIRGFLAEYGIVLAKGAAKVRKRLPELLEDGDNGLTIEFRSLLSDLYEELVIKDGHVKRYDTKLKEIHNANEVCRRLSEIEGIGYVTATMLLVSLGDGKAFKNGRHFAAYLGLVPRQRSSGGKTVLLGISKRGDCYLRGLLVHGGRSVVKCLGDKRDRRSCWAKGIKERRGYNRTAVAIANKNARIAWSIVAKNESYIKAA